MRNTDMHSSLEKLTTEIPQMPTQRTRAKLLFIGELLNEYFDKVAVARRQKKSFVLLQQLDLALLTYLLHFMSVHL